MIAAAVAALLLAGAPNAEDLGSVDGPFVWVDARASVDATQFQALGSSVGTPFAGQFASGVSVLGQGQLFGGWGLRVLGRRLALSAAFTGTGVVSDIYWLTFQGPRFDVSPLLLTSALVLPVDRVVLVPMLGFELPTRAFFNSDPILALQPQLRVRAAFDSLVVGGSVFLNLPVVTDWGPTVMTSERARRRCPPGDTHCRMPVTRELWRVGISARAEYWLLPSLSVGARAGLEARGENLGLLVVSSQSIEGGVSTPGWHVLEASVHTRLSWAFFEHFGLTLEGGLSSVYRREWPDLGEIGATSWSASLAIWFRTDARLQHMWQDR